MRKAQSSFLIIIGLILLISSLYFSTIASKKVNNQNTYYNLTVFQKETKESKSVKIQSGIETTEGDIDTQKEGIDIGSVSKSYTKNTKTECKGNTCNMVVADTTVYNPDSGNLISNEPSLKDNTDFQLVTSIDKDYDVDIIDYNLSSISLCLKPNKNYIGKDVPLVVYEPGLIKDSIIFKANIRIEKETDEYCNSYPFGRGYIVKYGFNSTTIAYNSTMTTKSMLFAWNATWSTARLSTAGFFSSISIKTTAAMTYELSGDTRYYIYRAFLPFDTSSIPDNVTINSASLCLWVSTYYNFDIDNYNYLVVVGNTSQATTSSLIVQDYDTCGNSDNPIRMSEPYLLTSRLNKTWACLVLNQTGIANINKYGYTKFGIREGHDTQNHAVANDKRSGAYWNSSLTSAYPRLNITYSFPATVNPYVSTIKLNASTVVQNQRVKLNLTIKQGTNAISRAWVQFTLPNGTKMNKTAQTYTTNTSLRYVQWNNTVTVGKYNITHIWVNDTSGNKNLTVWSNRNFTVTESTPSIIKNVGLKWYSPIVSANHTNSTNIIYQVKASCYSSDASICDVNITLDPELIK